MSQPKPLKPSNFASTGLKRDMDAHALEVQAQMQGQFIERHGNIYLKDWGFAGGDTGSYKLGDTGCTVRKISGEELARRQLKGEFGGRMVTAYASSYYPGFHDIDCSLDDSLKYLRLTVDHFWLK